MTKAAQPLVTIAIPTYNRADGYLKDAVSSALRQTYENVEVVVSDNCSTDGTEEFIKGISDKRIKYFRQQKNIGPNNNFNYCIGQAKGDYFLLLSDDDAIDEDFVEICMKGADYSAEFGIIRTGTRVIDAKGEVLVEYRNNVVGVSSVDFFRGWFAGKTAWYLCSTLFNTRRLREIGGFQSKRNLFQDGMAIVKLAVKYGRVDVPDIKASFRKHGGEITHAVKVEYWIDDFYDLLDLICELCPEDETVLREEGSKFFARLSYLRASGVQSLFRRLIVYIMVLRRFNYRFPPPLISRLNGIMRRMWQAKAV